MNTFAIKKITINTVTIVAITVFFVVLVRALFYSSSNDITVPQHGAVAAQAATADYPVSLSIPALHIHANIQRVGITVSGKMAVPTNFTAVGWYKYGTMPGQTGSAVMAGHVDDGLALPGVFAHLDELKPGDDIYIVTKNNAVLHFVMTASQAYSKDAATDGIFNDHGGKILRLITCTGTWLPLQSTHDQRLVVTAVLQA